MKKIIIALLCSISLCCAQLMPASSAGVKSSAQTSGISKTMNAKDSLKAVKVKAPVDYSMAVPAEGKQAESRSHAMSSDAMGPNKRDLFSIKNSLIATGTVFGMAALAVMTGTTYIPPLNIGPVFLLEDEEQVQDAVKKEFLSPKEQRLLEMQKTEMGSYEP